MVPAVARAMPDSTLISPCAPSRVVQVTRNGPRALSTLALSGVAATIQTPLRFDTVHSAVIAGSVSMATLCCRPVVIKAQPHSSGIAGSSRRFRRMGCSGT